MAHMADCLAGIDEFLVVVVHEALSVRVQIADAVHEFVGCLQQSMQWLVRCPLIECRLRCRRRWWFTRLDPIVGLEGL